MSRDGERTARKADHPSILLWQHGTACICGTRGAVRDDFFGYQWPVWPGSDKVSSSYPKQNGTEHHIAPPGSVKYGMVVTLDLRASSSGGVLSGHSRRRLRSLLLSLLFMIHPHCHS